MEKSRIVFVSKVREFELKFSMGGKGPVPHLTFSSLEKMTLIRVLVTYASVKDGAVVRVRQG